METCQCVRLIVCIVGLFLLQQKNTHITAHVNRLNVNQIPPLTPWLLGQPFPEPLHILLSFFVSVFISLRVHKFMEHKLVVNTCCCCCFRKWVTGGGAWHRARRIRGIRSRRCCQWLREHRARRPNGRLWELGHGRFVDILHCRLLGNVARILFTLRFCWKEDIYFIFGPQNQIMYRSNVFIEQMLTIAIIPMLKNQGNGQKLLIQSCLKGSHLPPHSSQSISSLNKSSKCTSSGTSSGVHISAACLANIFRALCNWCVYW